MSKVLYIDWSKVRPISLVGPITITKFYGCWERDDIYFISTPTLTIILTWGFQDHHCHQSTTLMTIKVTDMTEAYRVEKETSLLLYSSRYTIKIPTAKFKPFYKTEVSYLSLSPVQFGDSPAHSYIGIGLFPLCYYATYRACPSSVFSRQTGREYAEWCWGQIWIPEKPYITTAQILLVRTQLH